MVGEGGGLGGGFQFAVLGDALFDERGNIRNTVRFPDLARHVYFVETGEPLPRERIPNTPLIGFSNGRNDGTKREKGAVILKTYQMEALDWLEAFFKRCKTSNNPRFAYDRSYAGFTDLPKHFFPQIGNLGAAGEEFDCAVFLATQLEGVKYWEAVREKIR